MAVNFETIQEQLITGDMPEGATNELLIGLRKRYEEPWRHYHTFDHPLEQFAILGEYIDEVEDPATIGWTIMYHDAVYDPVARHGRNEELSAQLAEAELAQLGFRALGAVVARNTRATAGHAVDTDNDLNFFLDVDLAILGAAPERYKRYAADVRKEYAHVPEATYVTGRIAILEGLVTRVEKSGLYRTELFKEAYELQAQTNVAQEIDDLKGGYDVQS